MPFIKITTNVTIDDTTAEVLKTKLGKAITAFPGKSESWLMLAFDDDKKMYFQGSSEPCAIAEVSLFGEVNAAASDTMTAAVTAILGDESGISPGRIYVKYDGIANWGWNGSNF